MKLKNETYCGVSVRLREKYTYFWKDTVRRYTTLFQNPAWSAHLFQNSSPNSTVPNSNFQTSPGLQGRLNVIAIITVWRNLISPTKLHEYRSGVFNSFGSVYESKNLKRGVELSILNKLQSPLTMWPWPNQPILNSILIWSHSPMR